MTQLETLQQHFRTLRMPTAVQIVEETIATAQKENWSLETFLSEILEQEMEGRRLRRIERLKKAAHLPVEKTLVAFNQERLPLQIRRLLPQLCTGEFVDRAENLLVFGLPGRGKTHFAAAVGHELVNIGAVSSSPPPTAWLIASCGPGVILNWNTNSAAWIALRY